MSHKLLLSLVLISGLIAGCGHDNRKPSITTTPVTDAGDGSARFVDVAQAAGINYRWTIAGTRPLNILQTIGCGCAFLDYNNDGNLDILLIGPKLALYKGDGHGHFTDVTHQAGLDKLVGHFLGCAVGDYDNDGYDDLYITGYQTGLLLHNEAGTTFRDATKNAGLAPQPWGTSAAFADIDGDGKLDLYICNYLQFGPKSKYQLCNVSGHMTACSPGYYQPYKGVLYHNNGAGKFSNVTTAWGAHNISGKALGAAFADYNGSGHASLAIANDELPGDLLLNQGTHFTNIGASSGTAYRNDGIAQAGMGLDWGDYNNDGKLDLVVATFENEAKPVYQNKGNNIFVDQSSQLGLASKTMLSLTFGVKWLDYNNDGWLDLMMTNGHIADNVADYLAGHSYRQRPQIFRNDAGSHFTEMSEQAGASFQTPIVGRGLAVGDFDNDGKVDALLVDSEGPPILLHNESAPVGHWLSIKLVGTRSNRDGIGALVTVEAGGLKQTRLCHTDGSYLSASDRRVHVGLGPATSANITIHWPSGHIDTIKNVAVDRVMTIVEGKA